MPIKNVVLTEKTKATTNARHWITHTISNKGSYCITHESNRKLLFCLTFLRVIKWEHWQKIIYSKNQCKRGSKLHKFFK